MHIPGLGPTLAFTPALEAQSLRHQPTLSNTPLEIPPPGAGGEGPVLEVVVNSFIPDARVSTPWFVPGGGTFSGDGRNVGEEGTQRTQQTIRVYEDPATTAGYRVEVDAGIGETHRLSGDGGILDTASAPLDDLQAEVREVRADGTIVVQLSGQSANPLVGVAPGITYDLTVEMRPNPDGTWTVTSSGRHDGFPGYEVLASAGSGDSQVVYGYDPRVSGANAMALAQGDGGLLGLLWGGSRVEVDAALIIGTEAPTAEGLIERHTAADGTVDSQALAADLAGHAEAGNVDAAFVAQVFERLPQGRRSAVANAFFDSLSTTPGVGGGPQHARYASLAIGLPGMEVILAVGEHAPQRLAADQIIFGFASQNRESIHDGDPRASATASALLDALVHAPDAQQLLAGHLQPIYQYDREGLTSTPEGRSLLDRIERILG